MIFTSICNASKAGESELGQPPDRKPENGSPARQGHVRSFSFCRGNWILERFISFHVERHQVSV